MQRALPAGAGRCGRDLGQRRSGASDRLRRPRDFRAAAGDPGPGPDRRPALARRRARARDRCGTALQGSTGGPGRHPGRAARHAQKRRPAYRRDAEIPVRGHSPDRRDGQSPSSRRACGGTAETAGTPEKARRQRRPRSTGNRTGATRAKAGRRRRARPARKPRCRDSRNPGTRRACRAASGFSHAGTQSRSQHTGLEVRGYGNDEQMREQIQNVE